MSKNSPAHVLMSHGGKEHHKNTHDKFSTAKPRCYATGGYAEGGDTYDEGGETMRRGGRRHRDMGGPLGPGFLGPVMNNASWGRAAPPMGANPATTNPTSWSPNDMRDAMARYQQQYGYSKGYHQGYSKGGHAEGGETMRRGGRRHHADGGMNRNPHTGHPQYGILDVLDNIPILGDIKRALFAEGGETMRRGGRRHHAEGGETMRRGGRRHHAEGGETMRRGGRRHHADGGDTIPVEGKARANAIGGPQFARSALGGNRAFAEGGDMMRRGGHRSRRHHADGGYDD
jgi:hypothetical protein